MHSLTTSQVLLLFCAAALGSAVNAVAGGGQILSFPAAIAVGLPPLFANTANAASLAPGALAAAWGFRSEIARHRGVVFLLAGPTVAGSLIGALTLRHTPSRTFEMLIPWLLLSATFAIALQDRFAQLLQRAEGPRPRLALATLAQFLVAIYGGFFGVGMGLMMLVTLGLVGPLDLHGRVAVKSVLGALTNLTASAYFLASHLIDFRASAVMITGAIAGGTFGGQLARRASPGSLRRTIGVIGLAISLAFVWRQQSR